MGFRDDSEALRARTRAAEARAERAESEREQMERELADAQANDEADARRIAELEARLAKLEPRSRKAAGEQASSRRQRAVVGLAAVMAIIPGIVVFGILQGSREHDPVVSTAPEARVPEPPAVPEPEPPSPLERIRLAGVVRSADGVEGLQAGDGCVVDMGVAEGFSRLQVRCGADGRVATIYDGATASPMGMIQVRNLAAEAVSVPGRVTRTMTYSRTGQWPGATPQIQIDPDQHAARVWLQGIEARDVLLDILSSDFGPGERSMGESTQGSIARGTLAKLTVQGEVPGALGELDASDCSLRTEPQPRGPGGLTARLVARCGDRILYGAGRSGWVSAPAPADGEVMGPVEDTQMSAADTDPMMSYTGDTLPLVEPEWRVVFAVEAHPSCTLAEGSWVGSLRDQEGRLREGLSITDGELTLPDGEVRVGTEDMRCHQGVARWTTEGGTTMLEGHFGPGFATYVGRLGSGELIELYRQ
ncbi:MAG: hypothetical protein ACFCGT_20590 [Sandaracinaceae bacterium]